MTIHKLKFNTAVSESLHLEKKLFLAVYGTFFLLLSLYIFFVSQTIFNIVERKNAEQEMRILSSNLSSGEVEYMALAKDIDLNLAQTLGFNESANIYFASRRSAVGSLTNQADEL